MASSRIAERCLRGLRTAGAAWRGSSNRNAQSAFRTSTAAAFSRPALVGGFAAAAAGLGFAYAQLRRNKSAPFLLPSLAAASVPASQPSVFSGTKEHALYLWITLKPTADVKACAKIVANIQEHVDAVCPPSLRDEDDEIWAGVGFGPNFYAQVSGKPQKAYHYPHRKGPLGEMPSTGGDIFVHAKSNSRSKLFELAQRIISRLPKGSVAEFEDVYGWVYQNGRDLSGFIDGTENPADTDGRQEIAVEKSTGGSYVITQKWIHNLDYIATEKDSVLEAHVGRARSDSTELSRKPATSHVARMTGGTNFEQKKAFEIVRQSQPFGSLSGEAGLFFIAYASSPENFEYMLDRMVGATEDGLSDHVMKLSRCVKGTYWYFPGESDLKKLKQ